MSHVNACLSCICVCVCVCVCGGGGCLASGCVSMWERVSGCGVCVKGQDENKNNYTCTYYNYIHTVCVTSINKYN